MKHLVQTSGLLVFIPVLFVMAAAAPSPVDAGDEPMPVNRPKKASPTSRLILPFFEVDMTRSDGANTFFSVRNEISQERDITVSYYASDQPNVAQNDGDEPITLQPKELRQFVVSNQTSLLTDADGFARGYVVIETTSGEAVIQGEYFQINPAEKFASGFRLLNGDPASENYDLCSVFTIRFMSGGAFDDTEIKIFLDTTELPDPDVPVASYNIYNQQGDLTYFSEIYVEDVAFKSLAADLTAPVPTPFGVMEIQLNNELDLDGHVSGDAQRPRYLFGGHRGSVRRLSHERDGLHLPRPYRAPSGSSTAGLPAGRRRNRSPFGVHSEIAEHYGVKPRRCDAPRHDDRLRRRRHRRVTDRHPWGRAGGASNQSRRRTPDVRGSR